MTMNFRRRVFVAILLFLLLPAFWLFGFALRLLSQPSDASLAAGVLILLSLFVAGPSVLGYIYRKL
jgi:hypothetical protein